MPSHEVVFEANYGYRLASGVVLRPNVQYIVNPDSRYTPTFPQHPQRLRSWTTGECEPGCAVWSAAALIGLSELPVVFVTELSPVDCFANAVVLVMGNAVFPGFTG